MMDRQVIRGSCPAPVVVPALVPGVPDLPPHGGPGRAGRQEGDRLAQVNLVLLQFQHYHYMFICQDLVPMSVLYDRYLAELLSLHGVLVAFKK